VLKEFKVLQVEQVLKEFRVLLVQFPVLKVVKVL
jgi:hypothetical protein